MTEHDGHSPVGLLTACEAGVYLRLVEDVEDDQAASRRLNRLVDQGKVRPCLFSHDEWDLGPYLRRGADDTTIARFLADATWTKPPGHGIGSASFAQPERTMSAIGG